MANQHTIIDWEYPNPPQGLLGFRIYDQGEQIWEGGTETEVRAGDLGLTSGQTYTLVIKAFTAIQESPGEASITFFYEEILMATYAELSTIQDDAGWIDFHSKVRVAALVKAASVIDDGAAPASRLAWAKSAMSQPGQAANAVIMYVVASNAGQSISAIVGAADGAIQSNVSSAVDALYQ